MLPDEVTVNFKFRPKLWLVSPIAALLVFGLFQLPWGAASAPAWVQAVGSIAAIFAAWIIPFVHEQTRRKKVQNDVLDSAGWLAFRISNSLEHMASVIERTGLERNPSAVINRWRFLGQPSNWAIHHQAADELPMSAFTGADIGFLLAIRGTAAFGLECAEIVNCWDFEKNPDMVGDFPLHDRMSFHKSQISWVLENTLHRTDK